MTHEINKTPEMQSEDEAAVHLMFDVQLNT